MSPLDSEPSAGEGGADVPGTEARDEPPRRSVEHGVLLVVALLGVVGLIALGIALEPDPRGHGTHEQLGLEPCYPLVAFNFPCPGCGLTTSVVRLTRGDVVGSLVAQPLGTLLACGAVVFAFWAMLGHVRGRDLWLELNRFVTLRWGVQLLGFALLTWLYKIASVRHWL